MSRTGARRATAGGCIPACARDGSMLGPGGRPSFTLLPLVSARTARPTARRSKPFFIVRVRAAEGLNTAKYYGKWSFERAGRARDCLLRRVARERRRARLVPAGTVEGELGASGGARRRRDVRLPPPPLRVPLVRERCRADARVAVERGVPRQRHAMDARDGLRRGKRTSSSSAAAAATGADLRRRRGRAGWRSPSRASPRVLRGAHLRYVNRRQQDGTKYHFQHNMSVMVGAAVFHWCLMLRWAFFGKREGKRPGRNYLAACCLVWRARARSRSSRTSRPCTACWTRTRCGTAGHPRRCGCGISSRGATRLAALKPEPRDAEKKSW